ncbi:MAG: putative metal-binding motif-containing protein, partial [Myxococcota bacterium]
MWLWLLVSGCDFSGAVCTGYRDNDGDGFGAGAPLQRCEGDGIVDRAGDCDDTTAAVHPGATEVCDERDNDCDGVVDRDGDTLPDVWYTDRDGDGFGDPLSARRSCPPGDGFVRESTDCDDDNASVYPSADERCDDLDNDCDGFIDEDAIDFRTVYRDADGDGFGAPGTEQRVCSMPPGLVEDDTDCNDFQEDDHPGADEVCDGRDNDCDEIIDVLSDLRHAIYFADVDRDGFGDPDAPSEDCAFTSGFVRNASDCDDTTDAVNPDMAERCDRLDNDCDDAVDEGPPDDARMVYVDDDGDGFGDPSTGALACFVTAGYSEDGTDCDDADVIGYPGADEICDAQDNDCDSVIDEEPVDGETWYRDEDGDGYGHPDDSLVACEQPDGFVMDGSDCTDADADAYPGTERCDCAVAPIHHEAVGLLTCHQGVIGVAVAVAVF